MTLKQRNLLVAGTIKLEESIARIEESLFEAEKEGNTRRAKALKKVLSALKRKKSEDRKGKLGKDKEKNKSKS